MDKEKVLVPSVISLHVRSTDQNDKESLKNLFNLPEPVNSRKLSYNLVRIYNTGYGNHRFKSHVNESSQPYIANMNPRTNFVSSTVILSRCHTSMKKNHLEYAPIHSHCRLSHSNPYLPNGHKHNHNIPSPFLRTSTSPNFDGEFSKQSNLICSSTSLNSNPSHNEISTSSLSNQISKKMATIPSKEELNQKTLHHDLLCKNDKTDLDLQCRNDKIIEVLDKNKKPSPIVSQYSLQSPVVEVTSLKSQPKTSVISNEKPVPKRSTSSFLIPIKERSTTTASELNTSLLTRSHTSFAKHSSSNQRYTPQSTVFSTFDSKKPQSVINNETTPKNNQLSLSQKLHNSKSMFISNSQLFLYSDPYHESPPLFLIRLAELAVFVNETVKWEKSKSLRRRCATQMQ